MGKLTKNRKLSEAKIDNTKLYNLDEACSLIKDITTTKFDASVDLANDVDSTNDVISGLSITNIDEPSAPSATGDTICMDSGDSLMLIANSGGGEITWSDAQGNVVSQTEEQQLSEKKQTQKVKHGAKS